MKIFWIAKRKAVDVEDGFGRRLIEQGEAIFMPPPKEEPIEPTRKKTKAKRGVQTYEPENKD